jgi:hypothetical protein
MTTRPGATPSSPGNRNAAAAAIAHQHGCSNERCKSAPQCATSAQARQRPVARGDGLVSDAADARTERGIEQFAIAAELRKTKNDGAPLQQRPFAAQEFLDLDDELCGEKISAASG